MEKTLYDAYVNILKEELVPAMGCTEPIAVAYAAAIARDTLTTLPETIELIVSGNIVKNVKSVVVPNTGGLRGIAASAAAGIIAGNTKKELEVIADVTSEQITQISDYLNNADNFINAAISSLSIFLGFAPILLVLSLETSFGISSSFTLHAA